MNLIFIFLYFSIFERSFSSQSHPGHLKPFGSAGPISPVLELSESYPDVSQLYTHHIPKSEPVLSRQVLNKDLHYSIWESDKELRNIQGLETTEILVHSYKEADRIPMSFTEFLARYKRENLFFADNLPSILR